MLTKKDLGLISELMDVKLDIQTRQLRDEFHSVVKAEVGASEGRMIKRMDEGFDSVLELIDDGILPDIHKLQREMIVVQKKLQIV